MKPYSIPMFRRTIYCLLLCLCSLSTAWAQVLVNTNTITGTVRFSNVNPDILNLLNPPVQAGISNVSVVAYSTPPALYSQSSVNYLPADSSVSAPYIITVDAENPGISYDVHPMAALMEGSESYYFKPKTSDPVILGASPVQLDFEECVGLVNIHFVSADGTPMAIQGGRIETLRADGSDSSILDPIPLNSTVQQIFLAGGESHQLRITVHQGDGFANNRIEGYLSTNVDVVCDQTSDITMVLPDTGVLGAIKGNFDIVGEFELTIPANTGFNEPDYSSLVAWNGPFGNQRWAGFSGSNFTLPSSGSFTLANVVPTTLDPLSAGYSIYAVAAIRTNRSIEYFRSPGLGDGSNPAVAVTPGETKDLGDLFVFHPGYMRGGITLQGAPEAVGSVSMLRAIMHSGDDTTNGIPNYFGTYGVYWSAVEAIGTDTKAPGATYTAASGVATTDFTGTFDPATGLYSGNYEFALGGLNGESSVWTLNYLTLSMSSDQVPNSPDYFAESLEITETHPPQTQIDPGQPSTNAMAYCFGDVKVVFRDPTGTFYSPLIQSKTAPGTFVGTNFLGQPANYSVYVTDAYGAPTDASTATNTGYVLMTLPQGNYVLNPSVTPGNAGSTYASAGLQPISLTVGCGQSIVLETCLQLSLNAPECANTNKVRISGSVRSCSNIVSSISYSLNNGPEQVICQNCGSDPSFAFLLDLSDSVDCSENILKVTTTDSAGGLSSVTTKLHYDPTPPSIQCPADMLVTATSTNGTVVNFSAQATDNCPGEVSVVTTPVSGSVFPIGTTLVTCVATDACGNTSSCTFNVTVVNPTACEVSIQPAVMVNWPCGNTLQSADSPTGPWTDIPNASNPYFAPVTATQKYYRSRF